MEFILYGEEPREVGNPITSEEETSAYACQPHLI
jgi:hypothetical protein